jgi:predicted nucleic acid-binding protein
MTAEPARRGLLDTNIMILRSRIAPEELPDEVAISAVTLAELSAGPHEVRPDTEQDTYSEAAERARRLDVLQRAEHEFDPIPFDTDAARAYGRVTAAAIAAGRKPRRRAVDLMIAATAIAAELPLYTKNPDDFAGLDHLVTVIPVTRPEGVHSRGLIATRRRVPVVEVLVLAEHACGLCPMIPGRLAGRVTWSRGCGL